MKVSYCTYKYFGITCASLRILLPCSRLVINDHNDRCNEARLILEETTWLGCDVDTNRSNNDLVQADVNVVMVEGKAYNVKLSLKMNEMLSGGAGAGQYSTRALSITSWQKGPQHGEVYVGFQWPVDVFIA